MAATDDVLKAKLVEYLGHLETAAKQGGEFVAAQAPDVVREMVAYRFWSAVVWLVINLVLGCVGVRLWRWALRPGHEIFGDFEKGFPNFLVASAALLLMFGGFLSAASDINTVLQCWLAPKYFVVQQLAGMLK